MELQNNKRLLISIIVGILLIISIGLSLYRYNQRPSQSSIAELIAYNDSIEKTNKHLRQIAEAREDSINKEDSLRFLAKSLITEIKKMPNCNDGCIGQEICNDWEKNLINLGFEKQPKKLEYPDEGGYDDELYDIFSIPYTRFLNGRSICVKPLYSCYKREQDGTWIPEKERGFSFINNSHVGSSFSIEFSDVKDKDDFMLSLRERGLTKHISLYTYYSNPDKTESSIYYNSDEQKYNPKSNKTYYHPCPSIRCHEDSLTIRILYDTDC